MQVLPVNPDEPRSDRLQRAADALRAGQVVALPTETFYGLAVDPWNLEALAAVNRLKGKQGSSPFLLLAADAAQAEQVAGALPDGFETLSRAFWPGPLTLVLPAIPELPDEISGGRGTVAIRVPGLTLPRRLARELGRPITGVSANLHGEIPARTAVEVAESVGSGVGLILDGGRSAGGAPSTIVDLASGPPRVLREGIVPLSVLRRHLPEIGSPSV